MGEIEGDRGRSGEIGGDQGGFYGGGEWAVALSCSLLFALEVTIRGMRSEGKLLPPVERGSEGVREGKSCY